VCRATAEQLSITREVHLYLNHEDIEVEKRVSTKKLIIYPTVMFSFVLFWIFLKGNIILNLILCNIFFEYFLMER